MSRTALMFACLALAGCMNVQLDEGDVFFPPKMEKKAQTAAELRLDNETAITAPAKVPAELDGRLPAKVVHEFQTMGAERIALSRVTPADLGPGDPLIVNCSGNASDRFHSGVWNAAKILRWGEVVMFDYPGYGDSTGTPTAQSMNALRDDMAAYVDRIGKGRPLVLWGHSLGGFVCSAIAEKSRETDAIVLETTALDPAGVAKAWKPWYLPFVQMEFSESLSNYNVAKSLAAFDGPILVIGAGKDTTLPVRLARSVNAALKAEGRNVRYVEYARAQHNNAALQTAFLADGAAFFRGVADTNR